MRQFFLIVLLLISDVSFSQSESKADFLNCHCPTFGPLSKVGKGTANKRIKCYAIKQKGSNQTNLLSEVSYDTSSFRKLLTKIVDPSSYYDGLRIYFAQYPSSSIDDPSKPDSGNRYVPNGSENQIVLIFVPTKIRPDDSTYHIDDTNNFWIITSTGITTLPSQIASMWIKKAQSGYLNQFQTDGVTHTKKKDFEETHSLWYSNTIIESPPNTHRGLLDFLNCRICKKDIDSIKLRFGAFLRFNLKGYNYKLTIVFNFHKIGPTNKEDNDYLSLNFYDLSSPSSSGVNTDTGLPCPPATNCKGASN